MLLELAWQIPPKRLVEKKDYDALYDLFMRPDLELWEGRSLRNALQLREKL